ncbi:MAG: VOC family protein [Deltaproteobacteria bacterium]|nr:VOC family protein [Deltaproteobacteria bacterium]
MPALFSYVELHSSNTEKSKGFYGELFGWRFEKAPVPDMIYYSIHGEPDQGGGLMPAEKDEPSSWLAYVTVPDIQTSLQRAERLGAKTLMGITPVPGHGTMAVLKDPTGAPFALWEELKKLGSERPAGLVPAGQAHRATVRTA